MYESVRQANSAGIKACFSEKTPVKAISIYLAVLAVLFYIMWLSEIVPALMVGRFRNAYWIMEHQLMRCMG